MAPMGGLGAKLLTKMGWKEGMGLGANANGITEPIAVKTRKDNRGVGAQKPPSQDPWWEKMMEDAYGKPKDSTTNNDLLAACEGRRCRPHGSGKLARLEAQDKNRKEVQVSDANGTDGDPHESENKNGEQRDKIVKDTVKTIRKKRDRRRKLRGSIEKVRRKRK